MMSACVDIILCLLFPVTHTAIIADYCNYCNFCDNSGFSHNSVLTYALSSQTSFKCLAGYMTYDIVLPWYADGLSCNIPVDKFPRSKKDIVC